MRIQGNIMVHRPVRGYSFPFVAKSPAYFGRNRHLRHATPLSTTSAALEAHEEDRSPAPLINLCPSSICLSFRYQAFISHEAQKQHLLPLIFQMTLDTRG